MNEGLQNIARICLFALALFGTSSCTYLNHVAKQSGYSSQQETDPSLQNLKHILNQQTYFVYGRIINDTEAVPKLPLAVVAFSDKFIHREIVDVTQVAHVNTHYGLNLPEGQYDLLLLSDFNANGNYDSSEVVGRRHIVVNQSAFKARVADNIDIMLSEPETVSWTINLPVPVQEQLKESIFFPRGSIRSLEDPVFAPQMTQLGLYEPAAFYEIAPTMFYALEEDSYKIPVVFVHGINGSPRQFSNIVNALDESLYKPWFFYYASGGNLNQLAKMFYEIFLSGRAVTGHLRLIVVAHSMGGLIVREALNDYQGTETENRVALYVSIATPFGGHPSAATGESHAPLVLPAWHDLNPNGGFIQRLYRKPLDSSTNHQLIFTYGDSDGVKFGENSDGVVPLSSQLYPVAQNQSSAEYGVNASHAGVLENPEAIAHIIQTIKQVKPPYPESHLNANQAGGFDVELSSDYSKVEKYYIRTRGHYLLQLATGVLDTLDEPVLEHFVAVAQGRAEAQSPAETAWLKFVRDHPDYLK